MSRIYVDSSFIEKIDTSGTGGEDAVYFMTVLMLVGGVVTLFTATGTGTAILGICMIVVACLTYVHLFRTTPQVRYFPYLWLDQCGIHHIEGGTSADRTARFAWHEIQSAEASSTHDQFRGLILTLKRMGMQGVPIYLSTNHAKEAIVAMRDFIDPALLR